MAVPSATVTQYVQGVLRFTPSAAQIAQYSTQQDAATLLTVLEDQATNQVNPVIRLYQAAFNRLPDVVGLNGWTAAYVNGGQGGTSTLDQIATGFVGSTEFGNVYGQTPVTGYANQSYFVSSLYHNVLNRSGSGAEIQAWIDVINSDLAKGMSATQTATHVLLGFSQSPEFQVSSATPIRNFQSGSAALTTPLTTNYGTGSLWAQAVGATYTLTTGIDTFGSSSMASQQVFNAAAGTFTNFDTLTGGTSGNDTLNVASTAAYANPVGATVTGVENVNFSLAAGGTVNTAAGSGFTGVNALNIQSTGGALVATAAGTTTIAATNLAAAATNTTVDGGSAVTVTTTGNTTGAIAVGGTTAPTGAVTVTQGYATGNITGGNVAVTGGTTVTVNETATTNTAGVGTTNILGNVTVTGSAVTTSVTVNQSAAVTAAIAVDNQANTSNAVAATSGVQNGTVTINDRNAGSTTAAATITSVTLQNYGASTISSNALTSLNLSSTAIASIGAASGTLGLTYGLTTGNPTALALTLGGGSLGVITDNSNVLTTLNTTMTANTTLAGFTDTALRTINLSGTGVLTLSAVNTAITAITATGAAGLNANVSALNGLTSINFSGTSANNTLTLNATNQAYTGGSGNDVITISVDATRAITGGTGVDTIVLNAVGGTFTSANTGANVTGFETVGFNTGSSGTYALNTIGLAANATSISLLGTVGGALTVTGLAAGTTTFNINAAQGVTNTFQYAGTNGANTAVTLNLNGTAVDANLGGGTAGFAGGTVVIQDANAVGVGTINLVSNASVFQGLHTLTALNNTTTSVLTNLNITGSGSVTIGGVTTASTTLSISDNGTGTSTTSDGITTLTSQGNVLGNLAYSGTKAFNIGTLANNVANLTVTNANTGTAGVLTIGAHADNSLVSLALNGSVAYTGTNNTTNAATLSGATNNSAVNVTWNGAGGIKTITLGNGANVITTGTAADVITVGTGANTITAAAGADTITVAAGHTTVNRYILNSVVGTSSDSGQVVNAGQGNDVGQDTYVNANLTTDVFRAVATTVGSFNQANNTVIGTAGAATDGSAAAFTANTGLIYLGGTNAFANGDIAVTFTNPSATLTAANFRATVQYDLTTAANTATNTVVTGVQNDVLRANTQSGAGLDAFTGGTGSDNFVFASRANANNAMAGAATTTVLNDQITDFVVGTDVITLGTGANVFGANLQFAANTVANINTVTALGNANYANFDALATAVETIRHGVASNATTAQMYVVTTGTITTATGFSNKTFLVINDDTAAIAATDTWIDITGVNTTTLTQGSFAFGAGTFL